MPQPVRITAPNLFYLVTSTGAADTDIFSTEEHKLIAQQNITNSVLKYSYNLFAWSIMKNHYVIAVQSSDIPISKFVSRINTCYAFRYNYMNFRRNGPVFANSFSCMVIQDEKVNDIIRYVNLTPFLCNECTIEELDKYRWSSYYTLIIGNQFDHMLSKKELLSRFGDSDPIGLYKNFIQSQCEDSEVRYLIEDVEKDPMKSCFPEYEMIGNDEFAEKINPGKLKPIKRIPRYLRENITLNDIYKKVLSYRNLDTNDILNQKLSKKYLAAQNLFAAIARSYYEIPVEKIAEFLNVTLPIAAAMIVKGKRQSTLNRNLKMTTLLKAKIFKRIDKILQMNLNNVH